MTTSSRLYNHVLPEGSIRLLQFCQRPDQIIDTQDLKFSLLAIPLDKAPPYDALSYRWEDPSPHYPDTKVFCNDVEVHVGRNLHQALLQLLETEGRSDHLWVDFLCIEQSNHEEKQRQILMMTQIYPKAQHVIIWLGPAIDSEDSDQAMEYFPFLVRMLNFVDKPHRPPNDIPLNETEVQARDQILSHWNSERDPRTISVWKLFNRPWFKRTWTLQEAALASEDCVVLCGTKLMRYSVLRHFADKVMSDTAGHWLAANSSIRSQQYGTDPENPPLPPIMHSTVASRMRRALQGDSNPKTRQSAIIRLLNSLRPLDCTDPRDRIFSVSAFLPEQLNNSLRARGPLSTEELYTSFAEIELGSNNNLLCLAAAGLSQQRRSYPLRYATEPAHTMLQLPTWVPDWTYRKINDPLFVLDLDLLENRGHHLYEAATKLTPEVHTMTSSTGSEIASVKAYMLDTISNVSKPFRIHFLPKGTNPNIQPQRILDMLLDYQTQVDDYVSLARQHFRTPKDTTPSHQLTLIRQTLIGCMVPAASGAQDSHGLLVRSRPEQVDPIFDSFAGSIARIRQICRQQTSDSNTTAATPVPTEKEQKEEEIEPEAQETSIHKPHINMISAVSAMCKGRRLFVTAGGNIGIGPDITQEDDQICVFLGACTPSVIRPVSVTGRIAGDSDGRTYHELVGECYMHGVMDGEVMETEGLKVEDVHLL